MITKPARPSIPDAFRRQLRGFLVVVWILASASLASVANAQAKVGSAGDPGARLAEEGQALLPIRIAPTASKQIAAVAEELATFLHRITGAKFSVEPGDASRGIVVGTLAEFPDPALDQPLEIRNGFDGREAFAIRTDAQRLRLIGATDRGASHAVFAFLEMLGCRWFFQAPEWEVVPSIPALRVQVNRDDRPVILARRIWYGGGFFEHDPESRPVRDYAAWTRRNRLSNSFEPACGHAWQSIIADRKAVFAEHPEFLALTGGKRQGEQLCVSNPALRALVVDWVLASFRKRPEADMVSLEPSDGGGHCECEGCAQIGTVSDRVFLLANEAARAVAKERPGKMVGLYAYNQHSEPPKAELEPNVYVQLTAGFTRGRYSLEELLDLWPRKCRNMGFYEYFSVWPWDFDQLPGGRANDVPYLRKQIPRYAALGATSIDCESSANFGLHGRGYYLASKLMWNPKADADAVLADFDEKAFGPAAPAMRRYYDRFDRGGKPLLSAHLLALGFRDVEEAAKLAAGHTAILDRIDFIKQYLRSVQLRWMVDRARDKAAKKELTLAAITHGYRTRYRYITHWIATRGAWAANAAKEFAEPSWAPADPAPNKPWAVDRPYTREEIEAEFQDGLTYFQPDPVEEKRFTSDLVPVSFPRPKPAPPAKSTQTYQHTLRYALTSLRGEPLEFSIVPGTIAHYRDMASAKWAISRASGEGVAGDRLPLDGKPHPISVPVPAAGLYYLDFDDSTAGWQMNVEAGRHATVVLDPTRRVEHAGWMQPMHFYVPKGTRELQYFWEGSPHWVHGPDGAKLKEVETRGAFVKVPVPEGADGKTWHFSRMMLGTLWFFNAPNYLAASPEALLVPRELAEKDELPRSVE